MIRDLTDFIQDNTAVVIPDNTGFHTYIILE